MPLVSIGLPVYNGENFLGEAIESILKQTFEDFELIVCDNASTDKTKSICLYYAAKDSRIRYYRNAKNIGAAANYNKTFHLSKGKYFKWVAHDDVCKKEYLESCLECFKKNNDAVLAYTKTKKIDENNIVLEKYKIKLPTDSKDEAVRYKSLLTMSHKCYEVFGLIRKEALNKTDLIGNYSHGDGVLLSQLALIGRFVLVPKYLFLSRKHSGQSEAVYWWKKRSRRDWAVWFDPKLKGKVLFPIWRVHYEYFRSIRLSNSHIRRRLYRLHMNYVWRNKISLMKEGLHPFVKFCRLNAKI